MPEVEQVLRRQPRGSLLRQPSVLWLLEHGAAQAQSLLHTILADAADGDADAANKGSGDMAGLPCMAPWALGDVNSISASPAPLIHSMLIERGLAWAQPRPRVPA